MTQKQGLRFANSRYRIPISHDIYAFKALWNPWFLLVSVTTTKHHTKRTFSDDRMQSKNDAMYVNDKFCTDEVNQQSIHSGNSNPRDYCYNRNKNNRKLKPLLEIRCRKHLWLKITSWSNCSEWKIVLCIESAD